MYQYLLVRHPLEGPRRNSTASAEEDDLLSFGAIALDTAVVYRNRVGGPVGHAGSAPSIHRVSARSEASSTSKKTPKSCLKSSHDFGGTLDIRATRLVQCPLAACKERGEEVEKVLACNGTVAVEVSE